MIDCPRYIEVFLLHIQDKMWRCYWNKFQKDMDEEWNNPFTNSGNVKGFNNGTFEVHAYDWSDEDQPYNFKYKDIEIRWYKYCGRGMYLNKELTIVEAIHMFNDCIESLSDGWNNKNGNDK